MTITQRLGFVASGLFLSTALIACPGPTWPNCEKDEHCVEKDGQAMGYVCFNQTCVECVDNAACEAKDPTMRCNDETKRCEVNPECESDGDCASVNPDYVCRASKCVPECAQDADCAEGSKCANQKCVASAAEAECTQDIDCGPNMKCDNGTCTQGDTDPWANVSASCRPADMSSAQPGEISLGRVSFDFDQSNIRPDMRGTLDSNVECLKQSTSVTLVIEGHCDARGTQEYNLALGDQRAESVKDYLTRMGVDGGRLRVVSKGENEPICHSSSDNCWSKNRRVEFIQKTTTY